MTDEISLGKARTALLVILAGLLIVFLLKIFSIKISFWILVVVAIVAIIFIALSYKRKSSVSTETETAEEPPVKNKRGFLWLVKDSPEEFWGLLILIAAFSAGLVYLLYFR